MDIKQIKEIARTMKENGLTSVEITEGDTCLRVERKGTPYVANTAEPTENSAGANHVLLEKEGARPAPLPAEELNVTEIKSPMVGVFFTKPSPEAEPYVKIGSRVKKGDTLCVIEAMKLLNEITAESDGEIVGICSADGQMVEYSQVLFQMV
jgi:acetyl-CoA carboxylase biotin carboxyl carrier protein